jgi:hypothetical protein
VVVGSAWWSAVAVSRGGAPTDYMNIFFSFSQSTDRPLKLRTARSSDTSLVFSMLLCSWTRFCALRCGNPLTADFARGAPAKVLEDTRIDRNHS